MSLPLVIFCGSKKAKLTGIKIYSHFYLLYYPSNHLIYPYCSTCIIIILFYSLNTYGKYNIDEENIFIPIIPFILYSLLIPFILYSLSIQSNPYSFSPNLFIRLWISIISNNSNYFRFISFIPLCTIRESFIFPQFIVFFNLFYSELLNWFNLKSF